MLIQSEEDVLAVIAANPGIKAEACADRVGFAYSTTARALVMLRTAGLVAPACAIVPTGRVLPGMTDRERDVLEAVCDGVDTIAALVSQRVVTSKSLAEKIASSLRACGALEPASGLYTSDDVERRQDAAWAELARTRCGGAA